MKINDIPDDHPQLSIHQVSEITKLTDNTIRYYERVGLLGQVKREDRTGYRRYSADDVNNLEIMACMRSVGIPIEIIKKYFSQLELGPLGVLNQVQFFEKYVSEVELAITNKNIHLQYLTKNLSYWDAVSRNDEQMAQEIHKDLKNMIKNINSLRQ